ncbi:hypothetical protein M378DRAFT_8413 [Amanita muscaria Koide BX008]|uniref:Uncharacterized protein n=1 Tax=Amanita muscaria (strain Koide BX008) TaxID=946122 RepID=A0A0C2SZQ7_AMAMK|nr:hypothetical protein M378DRAFT_8413 [Amanita muscaria Koide BX008]
MSLDFIYMVNCIQLRCKVISICLRTQKQPTTILRQIKTGRSHRTLRRYVQDGAKYCLLAGAGSIFMLAIAAVTKLEL